MKGSSIALLLGGGKKPKQEEGEDLDSGVAFDDAANECLRAIKARDNEMFAGALKDCIKICLEAHESGPGEDEISDEGEGEDY